MSDSKQDKVEYVPRYNPNSERDEYQKRVDGKMQESFYYQNIIKNSKCYNKKVKYCIRELNKIVKKEKEEQELIANLEKKLSHRTPYYCPICDNATMTVCQEVIGSDGYNVDDITLDDYYCHFCGYAH